MWRLLIGVSELGKGAFTKSFGTIIMQESFTKILETNVLQKLDLFAKCERIFMKHFGVVKKIAFTLKVFLENFWSSRFQKFSEWAKAASILFIKTSVRVPRPSLGTFGVLRNSVLSRNQEKS